MKSTGFNVLILGLAAALSLAACDRNQKRDSVSEKQIEKAQCSQIVKKGLLPQDIASKRDEAVKVSAKDEDKSVRTYVVKMKTSDSYSNFSIVDKSNLSLVTVNNLEAGKESSSSFNVSLDCSSLKASVVAPGISIDNLDVNFFVSDKNKGFDVRKVLVLTKFDEKHGHVRVVIGEYFDESGDKAAIEIERKKYKTIKMALTTTHEEFEIIQRSGAVENDAVKFDSSVLTLIAERMGNATPDEISKFLNESQAQSQEDNSGLMNNNKSEQDVVTANSAKQSTLSLTENVLINMGAI